MQHYQRRVLLAGFFSFAVAVLAIQESPFEILHCAFRKRSDDMHSKLVGDLTEIAELHVPPSSGVMSDLLLI